MLDYFNLHNLLNYGGFSFTQDRNGRNSSAVVYSTSSWSKISNCLFSTPIRSIAFWIKFVTLKLMINIMNVGWSSGTFTIMIRNNMLEYWENGPLLSLASTTGIWMHIAITNNNYNNKLYYNGVSVQQAYNLPPIIVDRTCQFGDGSSGSYIFFWDDLFFWNRALTATEVVDVMNYYN